MSGKTNDIEGMVKEWKLCQKNGTSFHTKKCSCCDKPVSRTCNTGVCQNCRGLQNRKCTRPDKATLLGNLMHSNFSAVGRMYGVSDNAVRKWCRSYALPASARDIKLLRSR